MRCRDDILINVDPTFRSSLSSNSLFPAPISLPFTVMRLSQPFAILLFSLFTSTKALPSIDSPLYIDLQPREANQATPDADGDPKYGDYLPKVDPTLPLDKLPDSRPQKKNRRFISHLVEDEIERVAARITDPALKRLWMNCYPSTLDTTLGWSDLQIESEPDHTKAFPRSFLITGDIEASWLRDSTSQINPYLPLLKVDESSRYNQTSDSWIKLYRLALGLVYQQSQFVLTNPLSNSFGAPKSSTITKPKNQAMNSSNPDYDWVFPPPPYQEGYFIPHRKVPVKGNDGVYLWESKWEVDSLANFLRLPKSLYDSTERLDFVNNKTWQRAVRLAIDTLRAQQRSSVEEHDANSTNDTATPPGLIKKDGEWQTRFGANGGGVYRFERLARSATETRSDSGFGEPAARNGLVKSAFRPSDDATVFPHLIPSNAQLAVSLSGISEILQNVTGMEDVASNAASFSDEIRTAITEHAIQPRKEVPGVIDAGDVYAYEVDGYGSVYYMDDANIPSLLSLPYLGYVPQDDATYQRTRKLVLSSTTNKWHFSGSQFNGIGGPHVGWGYAWPMSKIMQILTSSLTDEHVEALAFLRNSTAGTGLMHESINVNNATDFTRPWFAWVNGLFGEAIRKLEAENSTALTRSYD